MLRLTVLIENSAPEHLIAEHGLSLHLQYEGHAYLLDAGTSGIFVRNADALGIDLGQVEAAALSHGHDDHAGAFPPSSPGTGGPLYWPALRRWRPTGWTPPIPSGGPPGWTRTSSPDGPGALIWTTAPGRWVRTCT